MITNTITQILPQLIEQLLTANLQRALAPFLKANDEFSARLLALD